MTYTETARHVHYVTAREGGRTALLVGPFATHASARVYEDAARLEIAREYPFVAVGTARAEVGHGRVARDGLLNYLLKRVSPLGGTS